LIGALLSSLSLSGENLPDHIQKRLIEIEQDTSKVIYLIDLAEKAHRKEHDHALACLKKAEEFLNSDRYPFLYSKIGLLKATVFQSQGKVNQIDSIIQLIFPIIREAGFEDLEARAYHLRGTSYFIRGIMDFAIEDLHKAMEMNNRLGNVNEGLKQLNNIGLIWREEGEYDRALEYFVRFTEHSEKIGNLRYLSFGYANMGYVHLANKNYKEALDNFIKSLALGKKQKDKNTICTNSYLIADAYFHLGQLDSAKVMAKEAITYADSIQFHVGTIYAKRVLCEVATQENRFDEAIQYGKEAAALCESSSSLLYYQDAMEALLKAYKSIGDFESALVTHERLAVAKDSLASQEAKERLESSQLKFEITQKDQENQLLRLEKLQADFRFWMTLIILGLLSFLAYLLFRAFKTKQQHSIDLEHAIEERTKELQNTNRELESFTYIASHDLKEPIRNLISFSSLLSRKMERNDLEGVKNSVEYIQSNANQLYELVSDISSLTLIRDKKNLDKKKVDLNEVISSIQGMIRKRIEEANVKMTIGPLPVVMGDRSLLLSLFKNLIENGIKYNNQTQKEIFIDTTVESDGRTKIRVRDNGIGIEPEYHDHVFELFKRLHNRGAYQGSGLGLAISKQIAKIHQFDIGVESAPGEGSIFFIITHIVSSTSERHLLSDKSEPSKAQI